MIEFYCVDHACVEGVVSNLVPGEPREEDGVHYPS
jgi:hypothetical protein